MNGNCKYASNTNFLILTYPAVLAVEMCASILQFLPLKEKNLLLMGELNTFSYP